MRVSDSEGEPEMKFKRNKVKDAAHTVNLSDGEFVTVTGGHVLVTAATRVVVKDSCQVVVSNATELDAIRAETVKLHDCFRVEADTATRERGIRSPPSEGIHIQAASNNVIRDNHYAP